MILDTNALSAFVEKQALRHAVFVHGQVHILAKVQPEFVKTFKPWTQRTRRDQAEGTETFSVKSVGAIPKTNQP